MHDIDFIVGIGIEMKIIFRWCSRKKSE